jgi:hypothetical protein
MPESLVVATTFPAALCSSTQGASAVQYPDKDEDEDDDGPDARGQSRASGLDSDNSTEPSFGGPVVGVDGRLACGLTVAEAAARLEIPLALLMRPDGSEPAALRLAACFAFKVG